ncbi:DUF3618 domain-containing protein [Bradyrhizobium sp. BWA-3-5]|nr:DUF3618 domain-containing protein [Bradyrhizobium sp. BWA-3-5]WOH68971.1 DUF3618 domain-containing protein [Bradyrhizobium sp. BWA-3-5]
MCAILRRARRARNNSISPEFASKRHEPRGGDDMTRSVEELRRDSEQSRAELAATVDRLREQIADTAEDIRYKVSPEHIKAEVTGFISHKTNSWLDALKQQAMDNPMQAVAAGTAVAVPVLRLARGFPLPLLMIGAGLALTSKTVRDRAAEAAEPALEKVREVFEETTERAQSLGDGMKKAMSGAERQAAGMADEARQTAGGMAGTASGVAGDLRDRASQAADAVASKVRSGMDAASDMAKERMEQVRSTAKNVANTAPETASKVIRDNAALIGGLGVAIGAIIAASLPSTKAEAVVVGKASDSVKRAAGTAAQSGFEAAKDAALAAAEAAAKSVSDADLGGHASRITEGVTERLKEVADDVVTTAFDPSQTQNEHN